MSNFLVLPKVLKLRAVNQIVILNNRLLRNEYFNSTIYHKSIQNKGLNQSDFCSSFPLKYSFCSLYTCNHLWKSTRDDGTINSDIDNFRAEETKIEREYEEREKQQQDKQSHTEQQSSKKNDKIQKVRAEILEAALKYVPEKGWSHESIAHGAESMNYAGVVHGMFPNGAVELIHHFYAKCNRELIEQLERELDECTGKEDESGKIVERASPTDFAIKAIRLRLQMIIPYKETWPQALAIMTLPKNVPTSLAHLLTLVDDICYCAGDRSVDIGWYTRRIGLATIYKMVELHLLQDKSPEHQETWKFLERRIDEAILFLEFISTTDQKTQNMGKALGSAFQTARNILGMNCDKR